MTLLPANQPDLLLADHDLSPARQPDVQRTPYAGVSGEPGKGSVLCPSQLHLPTLMLHIRLLFSIIVGTILACVNRNFKRYGDIEVLNED